MSLLGRLIVAARRCASRNETRRSVGSYASTYGEHGDDSERDVSPVRKAVFISQSTDVFTNLALQHWLYCNYDFAEREVLLLWRNDPCVVLGRNQNPWKECVARAAAQRGMALARRYCDGGVIYYDSGNLNLSFFTAQKRCNRQYNRQIIIRALFREWQMRSTIDEHDDIVVEGGYKVCTGISTKLEIQNAYHHCTLLDMYKHQNLVQNEEKENRATNATTFVRPPTKNSVDVNSTIGMLKLITAIGKEYMRTNALLEDGGNKLCQQQIGFQYVNPTEDWFPGLNKLINEFRSWSWNFGKTPKFTVSRTHKVVVHDGKVHHLNLFLEVQNGIVEEVRMTLSKELASADFEREASKVTNLYGTRYNHEITDNIIVPIDCKTDAIQLEDKSNVMATQ